LHRALIGGILDRDQRTAQRRRPLRFQQLRQPVELTRLRERDRAPRQSSVTRQLSHLDWFFTVRSRPQQGRTQWPRQLRPPSRARRRPPTITITTTTTTTNTPTSLLPPRRAA